MRHPEDHFPADAARLAHIRQVIELARALEARRGFGGRLIAAALYHDLGYAPEFAQTGFHPVDSAVLARADGLDPVVTDAVLHHSGARTLAELSRPDVLAAYGPVCRMMDTELSRALTFCDNHTGPNGERFTLSERLAEIRQRHAARPAILAVLDRHMPQFLSIEAEFLPLMA